jgi:hypothetical protein
MLGGFVVHDLEKKKILKREMAAARAAVSV